MTWTLQQKMAGLRNRLLLVIRKAIDGKAKPTLRLQFTELAGRPIKSLTTIDVPQSINYGDVFQVQSKQLQGWTAEAVQDKSRFSGYGVKLVIRRGAELMVELSL